MDERLAPAAEALSAYEKAALDGVDPRCVPQHLPSSGVPIGSEIGYPDYPALDHETWGILFSRQVELLRGRAGDAFVNGIEMLDFAPDRIPHLADLSDRLWKATRWKVARVPGLIHEKDFFELLSRRVFPSTDYIRGREELDYTPAPDLFHDIFGHMPMLTEPDFADFYQLFGKAALGGKGADRLRLERLHWFTVEFGLIRQAEGPRVFGAGILSSRNEVLHALSDEVEVHPFDPEAIVEKDYDVWHLQEELFALDSFEQLVDGFRTWTSKAGLL